MRISGGTAKGVRLKVPSGARPASERVRQAVFSSLGETLLDASVLDLFCGSGAYGLEALSRGAAIALLVDRDPAAVAAARANASAAGLTERCSVKRADAGVFARRGGGPWGVVFADPPYESGRDIVALLSTLARSVEAGGVVVLETRKGDDQATPESYALEADRRYGDTRVRMFRREPR